MSFEDPSRRSVTGAKRPAERSTVERVVIVGGGIIGLCAAFALERVGARVTVLDTGTAGGGASEANAGWIVPSLAAPVPAPGLVRTSLGWMLRSDSPLCIKPRADPDLARWLLAFWRRCNTRDHLAGMEATAALGQQTMALYNSLAAAGVRFEHHRNGILFAYQSPTELEHDLRRLEPLRAFGLDLPVSLPADAMREREPALTGTISGGYWISGERHIRPGSLTAGLIAYLTARGVDIRSHTPVTGIDHEAGRATAVRTATGRLSATTVLICAGAWTPAVARMAGVRIPIQGGKGYSLDYSPPPQTVRQPIYLHEWRVAITPLDGMVRLAGTMEFSGDNGRVHPKRVATIARAGATCLHNWPADPGVARVSSGLRPMTPDGLPVIGWLPGFRNVAVASGHAMLGVTLAPATGAAIAELLTSGRPPDVIRPFHPGRFSA